jgi:uncharacterized MAPEG superfamily protein
MDEGLAAELVVFALSVLLVFVQIGLQGHFATKELGRDWNAGPRDGDKRPQGVMAGRAERAAKNLFETYPVFVGLALALAFTGEGGGLGAAGAWTWLVARVVYVPLYLKGVPYVRSLVWLVSVVGIFLMLAALVF